MRKLVSVLLLTVLLFVLTSPIISVRPQPETHGSDSAENMGDFRALDLPSTTSAEVRFDPDRYTFIVERGVEPGYRFNTTVELYDVTWLFAWQVRVYFNNTLLNATNAYYHPEEPIHTASHVSLAPVIDNVYNATHGYVQHGISALYPSYVNATSEDFPLGVGICIIEFEVLVKPPNRETLSSDLTLDNLDTRLRKDPSTIIPCTKKNSSYRLVSTTIRVPVDYPTIQEAINAAAVGDTIFVYNGTYYENVLLNKTLALFGENANEVVINGTGGTAMSVEGADYVTVDGFTMTSGIHGIYLFSSSFPTVSNNMIKANSGHGIYAYRNYNDKGCTGLVIRDNIILANGASGIYAKSEQHNGDCNSWIIEGNTIAGNGEYGIFGYAWGYWEFRDDVIFNILNGWIVSANNINGNGKDGIFGYGGEHSTAWLDGKVTTTKYYCVDWIVYRNNITSNSGIGISTRLHAKYWTCQENNIENNTYGIHLESESNTLRENQIADNTYNFGVVGSGIQDVDTSNTVDGKPIYYLINRNEGQVPSDAGYVALVDSSNITIRGFSVAHNEQGIMLIRTMNITLENMSVVNNMYGICLQDSFNLTLYSNQAINNTYGIFLQDSANGTLSDNKAINGTYGIYFKNSANCTITGTNVEENDYGVYLSGSSNNSITHNNFLRNCKKQAAMDGTAVNIWDNGYPLGGNYWSNQTGPDWCRGVYQNETASDGIVDLPYLIGTNCRDNYPLSAPWSSTIRIITPGNTTYRELSHNRSDTDLSFTLDFAASWIGYSLDNQSDVTITGNVTLIGLSYGQHRIIVYANDTSGNTWTSIPVHFAVTFLTDINYDKTVDIDDLVETTWRYGSIPGDQRWDVYADVNRDGIIDIDDVALVTSDYGRIW